MEASSTTLNISSAPTGSPALAPNLVILKHSHKANFGRYVANCPKCMAVHPDGPPERTRKAKAAASPEITNEQLIALLQERGLGTAAALTSAQPSEMATLVQLMLNREAKTLRKEDDEEKRRLQSRADMIQSAAEQIALVEQRQQNCETYTGHKKENGRSAIAGQIHNDGMLHLFCQRCFKMFPPRRPSPEQMSNAV